MTEENPIATVFATVFSVVTIYAVPGLFSFWDKPIDNIWATILICLGLFIGLFVLFAIYYVVFAVLFWFIWWVMDHL